MSNTWFQFQQFRVEQDRCAMKISTDAILLGSLVVVDGPERILDIGTGTGVIALMLAQRFPEAIVVGVELDADASKQAEENMNQSPFASRMRLWKGKIQEYQEVEKFDLIVSNPPYFSDHLKSKETKRKNALHTDSLSFDELIQKAKELLNSSGKFWVILPFRQMEDFRLVANEAGFFEDKTITIYDRKEKPALRVVSSFTFQNLSSEKSEIVLKSAEGVYSNSYRKLLAGFLLGY